jgi:glycogen synthase
MKILHTVEFYYPSVGGAQEVVRHLSERMVKMGHDVTIATTKLPDRSFKEYNGVKIVEFDVSGNKVNGFKGKDVKKYKDFLKNGKFFGDSFGNYVGIFI